MFMAPSDQNLNIQSSDWFHLCPWSVVQFWVPKEVCRVLPERLMSFDFRHWKVGQCKEGFSLTKSTILIWSGSGLWLVGHKPGRHFYRKIAVGSRRLLLKVLSAAFRGKIRLLWNSSLLIMQSGSTAPTNQERIPLMTSGIKEVSLSCSLCQMLWFFS